jgi:hypothetical protein
MNFKNFYRKHVDKVVIILIILLFLKGCGKRSAERRMDFASTKYEMTIDSLNNIIDNKASLIDSLYNVNALLVKDIEHLTVANKSLSTSNDYYKVANKVLINSNKDLIETNSKNK